MTQLERGCLPSGGCKNTARELRVKGFADRGSCHRDLGWGALDG